MVVGIVGIFKKIGGDLWDFLYLSGIFKVVYYYFWVISIGVGVGKIMVVMDGGFFEYYI